MKAQGAGKIVTVSSQAGRRASSDGGYAHYGTAKAAIIMYTKYLAQDLGPHGIQVNCIAPGYIGTGRLMPMFEAGGVDRLARSVAAAPHRHAGGLRPRRRLPRRAGVRLRHRHRHPDRRRQHDLTAISPGRPRPGFGDQPGPFRVAGRRVVDAVALEPVVGTTTPSRRAAGSGSGPWPPRRARGSTPPCAGSTTRRRHERLDVDPQHGVVADDRHHAVDALGADDARADGDVGRVGGAEGEHPAARGSRWPAPAGRPRRR